MKDTKKEIRCRFCGKKIAVIKRGRYRKVVVDAEVVYVAADPLGEEFIRPDGNKVLALEIALDSTVPGEWAYRPHKWSCRRPG